MTRLEEIEKLSAKITVDLSKMILRNCKTCINCDHFITINERCGLVNERPPARVIAFGCPKFEEGIPF